MSIEQYEFEDFIAEMKVKNAYDEPITIETVPPWIYLTKNDDIAMAKHFNVKEGDLC